MGSSCRRAGSAIPIRPGRGSFDCCFDFDFFSSARAPFCFTVAMAGGLGTSLAKRHDRNDGIFVCCFHGSPPGRGATMRPWEVENKEREKMGGGKRLVFRASEVSRKSRELLVRQWANCPLWMIRGEGKDRAL